MVDLAAVDSCPTCHIDVRRMPSREGPWYCRACIRAQLEFGRDALTPHEIIVDTGDYL